MQSAWKPAVWLHFHADSNPAFLPFHMSAVALTLDGSIPSCHLPQRPNSKWYDLNAFKCNYRYCKILFLLSLTKNNSI